VITTARRLFLAGAATGDISRAIGGCTATALTVALGDPVDRPRPDRGVPRRDREGEETLARLRNGEAELGDPRYTRGDMRITGCRRLTPN
jgi:hypothetical protein